ncbi:MAG TPA: CBS domain-containing protein [Pseudonocardia sp.]|nr:CBS domain-containing protein [Pseudonocardia sp.]
MRAETADVRPSDPVRRLVTGSVAAVDTGRSLRDVADELLADEIGAVLVTDVHGPVGVLSERDLVAIVASGRDPDAVQAGDAMTTELVWAGPDDSVRRVGMLMRDAGVRHVPVGDGREVVGVVSVRDVLAVLLGPGS